VDSCLLLRGLEESGNAQEPANTQKQREAGLLFIEGPKCTWLKPPFKTHTLRAPGWLSR